MTRIAFKPGQEVQIGETATYMTPTEEGPMPTWDFFVGLTPPTSGEHRAMVHFKRFRRNNRYGAEQFAEQVRAAGSYDPQYWVEAEEEPSLEERFAMYAEEDAEERYAYTGSYFG